MRQHGSKYSARRSPSLVEHEASFITSRPVSVPDWASQNIGPEWGPNCLINIIAWLTRTEHNFIDNYTSHAKHGRCKR